MAIEGRQAAAEPTSIAASAEVRVTMAIGRGGASVVLVVAGTTVYLTGGAARRMARALELHADELDPPASREAASGG